MSSTISNMTSTPAPPAVPFVVPPPASTTTTVATPSTVHNQPATSQSSPATSSDPLLKNYENLEAVAEHFKWQNVGAPGMVYRGDIVKMIQKLIGLCVWDNLNKIPGFKAASRYNIVELEFRKCAEDFVGRRGWFSDTRLDGFFEDHVKKYLTFERGRAVSVGALLSSKYPAKGETLTMKEGSKIWNDAYDTKRILANNLMPQFEKKLVKGLPPLNKTWDTVLEEFRQELFLEKLAKVNPSIDKESSSSAQPRPPPASNLADDDWIPNLCWLSFILFGQYGRHKYGTNLGSVASFYLGNYDEDYAGVRSTDATPAKRQRGSDEGSTAASSSAAVAGTGVSSNASLTDLGNSNHQEQMPLDLALSIQKYMADSKNIRALMKASLRLLETQTLPQEVRDAHLKRVMNYQALLEEHMENAPLKNPLMNSKKKKPGM